MAEPPNAESALGRRIRDLRAEHGWSRDTLARKSGTASLTILRVELHGVEPTLTTLRSWAAAFGVPVASLIEGDPAEVAS